MQPFDGSAVGTNQFRNNKKRFLFDDLKPREADVEMQDLKKRIPQSLKCGRGKRNDPKNVGSGGFGGNALKMYKKLKKRKLIWLYIYIYLLMWHEAFPRTRSLLSVTW